MFAPSPQNATKNLCLGMSLLSNVNRPAGSVSTVESPSVSPPCMQCSAGGNFCFDTRELDKDWILELEGILERYHLILLPYFTQNWGEEVMCEFVSAWGPVGEFRISSTGAFSLPSGGCLHMVSPSGSRLGLRVINVRSAKCRALSKQLKIDQKRRMS